MKILIKVDTGKFNDVYEASKSQDIINWWDLEDNRAQTCTHCFLAVDLYDQLQKVENQVYINNFDVKYDTLINIGIEKQNSSELIGEQGKIESYIKDNIRIINLYGIQREGTINAVYEFLNKLGYRYFNTDTCKEIYPIKIIFKDYDYITSPDYVTRGCYNSFTDDTNLEFIKWMTRNKMNMLSVKKYTNPNELKKRGIKLISGGHEIFYDYLNPKNKYPYTNNNETYFDIHPEWFALIDGKRSNRNENDRATEGYYTGDNICTSNTKALEELNKNVIQSLIDGDYKYCDLLNLWAYDNGTWCQCEKCEEIGNYATRMLMFAYYLNRQIKKNFKSKKLGRIVKLIIPIYHETLIPPLKKLPEDFDYENIIITYFPIERCYAHYINDETCTETNLQLKNLLKKWATDKDRKYKGEVFIGEYFNVSSFASMPFIFTDKISNAIPYYYNNNSRHFYYMHISTDEWGMLTLNNYLIAKLLWDTKANKQEIINEYYDMTLNSSKEKMKQFHDILEKASSNAKYLKHYQFNEKGDEKPSLMWKMFDEELFPLKHCKFDYREDDPNASLSFVETIELFEKAKILIEDIYTRCSKSEKHIIEIEKMRFDYGYLVFKFLFNLVKLRFAHRDNNIEIMKIQLNITENLRIQLEPITRPIKDAKYECSPWLDNGFTATWVSKRYLEYIEQIKKVIN